MKTDGAQSIAGEPAASPGVVLGISWWSFACAESGARPWGGPPAGFHPRPDRSVSVSV